VLGLQLNKQETLITSITNSSQASTRVHFFDSIADILRVLHLLIRRRSEIMSHFLPGTDPV